MNTIRRTPTVVDTHGHVLTLEELIDILKISRTTAKRLMESGRFPIPALPRHGEQGQSRYRFAAVQVDRFLAREMDDMRVVRRRA